ncbi:hypothetical protein F8388_010453 [Cannabis sativa]|uniref:Uncharacterized protein n=1 Tax=Cannabis sativa TaxID=3483 RepID=A0A7J6GSK6_CANSA|nr:hypothetical protein F8388_010453 [Cannabis sativa]KAF4397370.1 hypothetical protein G4B88_027110 [Cannabis sativa]
MGSKTETTLASCNQQNQETNKEKVVDNHQERDPQVGDEETLEDLWNGRHSRREGDRLRGIERGYSEDDSSGGEEREGKEEYEVAELEDKEKFPSVTSLFWVSIRVLELGKEWVGEERVGQDGKRKWEN